MTNITKFILMAVAWLLFYLVTFYGCVKPTCCASGSETTTSAAAPTPEPSPPPATMEKSEFSFYSTLGASSALTGALWPDKLADLRATYAAKPGDILEVYGQYYESEPKPTGFENMGFARADEIKNLLVKELGIDPANVRTLARLLPAPAPAADERFGVATFNWAEKDAGMTASGEETAEVVQLDQDHIKIRFPYNQSTENLNQKTEDYLKKLAARIKETSEKVQIVGHTDSRGQEAYNQRLGMDRADFVKKRLVSYGAPGGLISISSRGENVPESTNATSEGRRLNRRAEITLLRE